MGSSKGCMASGMARSCVAAAAVARQRSATTGSERRFSRLTSATRATRTGCALLGGSDSGRQSVSLK
eukprot:113209-Pyramimonas_sp.AAC.1